MSQEVFQPAAPAPWRGWVLLRRCCQIFCWLLFVWLFLQATYGGSDQLRWPVDLFFRFDPLLLLTQILSRGPWIWGLSLSLLFVVLTLMLGRFFCGWVCPLGTTLDACRYLFLRPPAGNGPADRWRRVKYYLLVFLLVAAVLQVNLVGLLDPMSLLYRTLVLVFYPAAVFALEAVFGLTYQAGGWLETASEPLYRFLKSTILPLQQPVVLLPLLTAAVFGLLLLLEARQARFWCRAFCPLGALYGVLARFSWLRRRPVKLCPDCGDCRHWCKMGAAGSEEQPAHQPAECLLCLDCLARCQKERVSFRFGRPVPAPALDLGRRQLVTTVVAGVVAAPLLRLPSVAARPDEFLLRPPGVISEGDFLARCARCGQCFKVCPTGGLQPVWWEAGLDGLYTSRLVPRLGYCEYNCTLCAQVCPTGAIPVLPLEIKQAHKIGTAFINQARCIPYTEGRDCLVCEEHCPTAPKAIFFHTTEVVDPHGMKVKVKLPWVDPDQCIGCGTCENKCPVGGEAAIRVKRTLRAER